MPAEEHLAVSKFRDYLRINTEQPDPKYYECKDWLFKYGNELGFKCWSYECVPRKPIVGMTLEGSDPKLPSLYLSSHTDVVPTFRKHWTHDPYSAFKDADGNIFARGAQDMKCVGIQYMEAIRELKRQGKKLLRTIHVLWTPDEEIGSHDGVERFVNTERFRELNIGFGLDEGLASEDEVFKVYYAERCVWWMMVTFPGNPGHGSRFLENTAGPKLSSFLASVHEFRDKQMKLLSSDPKLTLGDVTSINVTRIEGGVQTNVIPAHFSIWLDVRLTIKDSHEEMEAMLAEWCKKAGEGVTIEFEQKGTNRKATPTTKDDPWWNAFSSVLEEENCKYSPEIFIGGTDARFLRGVDIRAIGFSPINNTPVLLHDHNEFLNESVFLRGVQLYTKIIERLANVPPTK